MGSPLKCVISLGKCDQGTLHLAEAVHPYLEAASAHLSRDYGGSMAHLLIELEMSPVQADVRPAAWRFRFQRRVSSSREERLLGLPARENVGHFSVRPDYFRLAEVALEDVPGFLLELIYDESVVLEKKSLRLGGFDAKAFRRDLFEYIAGMRGIRES